MATPLFPSGSCLCVCVCDSPPIGRDLSLTALQLLKWSVAEIYGHWRSKTFPQSRSGGRRGGDIFILAAETHETDAPKKKEEEKKRWLSGKREAVLPCEALRTTAFIDKESGPTY